MRELSKESHQAWCCRVILEELNAAIASARVVHKLMLSVEINVSDTTAFAECASCEWTLALLAGVPDGPFTLVEFVETARDDRLVINPLHFLRLGSLVTRLLPSRVLFARVKHSHDGAFNHGTQHIACWCPLH